MTTDAHYPDVGTLTAVIARSPIVAQLRWSDSRPLPPGFDEVDVVVLEWIAAEARSTRLRMHSYLM